MGIRDGSIVNDRRIVRYSKINSSASLRQIQKDLNLVVSGTCIRKRLMDNNFLARSPLKVPLLTKKQAEPRLKFVQEQIIWQKKKNGEIYCGPTKSKLFYLVTLSLDSMLNVRPTPNLKVSIHKSQLNMMVQN